MILENGIEVSCLLSVQCCTELKKIHSVNVRHPHYDWDWDNRRLGPMNYDPLSKVCELLIVWPRWILLKHSLWTIETNSPEKSYPSGRRIWPLISEISSKQSSEVRVFLQVVKTYLATRCDWVPWWLFARIRECSQSCHVLCLKLKTSLLHFTLRPWTINSLINKEKVRKVNRIVF